MKTKSKTKPAHELAIESMDKGEPIHVDFGQDSTEKKTETIKAMLRKAADDFKYGDEIVLMHGINLEDNRTQVNMSVSASKQFVMKGVSELLEQNGIPPFLLGLLGDGDKEEADTITQTGNE